MTQNQRGFGLIELLVALATAGIVLASAVLALEVGLLTFTTSAGRAETLSNARVAIQRMTPDIRDAGYEPSPCPSPGPGQPPGPCCPGASCGDPTSCADGIHRFCAIVNQSATSFTLQSDQGGQAPAAPGDGLITPAGAGACDAAAPSETVRYSLVGNQLRRSVNTASGSCETPIIGGVQALSFTYLGADGNVTAVSANIRTIVLSLTVVPETAGYNPNQPTAVTVTDKIRLRNR